MILPGIFDGLNLRMAVPLMIPVLLAAGALVPLAGQVLTSAARPTPGAGEKESGSWIAAR
jgi:hypothetical protein